MNSNISKTNFSFNQIIKTLRKQKGYTQQELATKFNVTKSVISYYEKATKIPSPDVLVRYADEFNVSVDYLLGREQPTPKTIDVNGLSSAEIKALEVIINSMRKK